MLLTDKCRMGIEEIGGDDSNEESVAFPSGTEALA